MTTTTENNADATVKMEKKGPVFLITVNDDICASLARANAIYTDEHSTEMRNRWMRRGGFVTDSDGNYLPYCTIVPGSGFVGMCLKDGDFDKLESSKFYKDYLKEAMYRNFMKYEQLPFQMPGSTRAIDIYRDVCEECGYADPFETRGDEYVEACIKARQEYNKNKSEYMAQNVDGTKFTTDDDDPVVSDAGTTNPEDISSVPNPDNAVQNVTPDAAYSAEIKKPQDSNVVSFGNYMEEYTQNGSRALRDQEYLSWYAENNAKFVQKYPGLKSIEGIAKSAGYHIKFGDTNPAGLVKMDLYVPGIQDPFVYMIDPCKIRPYYNLMLISQNCGVFDYINIPFSKVDRLFSGNNTDATNLINECKALSDSDRAFYHHIQYNSLPESKLDEYMELLMPLTRAMDAVGLDVRFKVESVEPDGSLHMVTKNCGLSKFALGNRGFEDLKLVVKINGKDLYLYASGKSSKAFAVSMPKGVIDKYEEDPKKVEAEKKGKTSPTVDKVEK